MIAGKRRSRKSRSDAQLARYGEIPYTLNVSREVQKKKRLEVRIAPADLKQLARAARRLGVGVSTYVRVAALERARVDMEPDNG